LPSDDGLHAPRDSISTTKKIEENKAIEHDQSAFFLKKKQIKGKTMEIQNFEFDNARILYFCE